MKGQIISKLFSHIHYMLLWLENTSRITSNIHCCVQCIYFKISLTTNAVLTTTFNTEISFIGSSVRSEAGR